jgi:hypothetical protein
MAKIDIKIYEIVGDSFCVSADDGEKVYDQIVMALEKKMKLQISFANVQRLTSAFLNVAIGQLYGKYTSEVLRSHLTVSEIIADDSALLTRVIETAKQYYANPERFTKIQEEVLGEEENVS